LASFFFTVRMKTLSFPIRCNPSRGMKYREQKFTTLPDPAIIHVIGSCVAQLIWREDYGGIRTG